MASEMVGVMRARRGARLGRAYDEQGWRSYPIVNYAKLGFDEAAEPRLWRRMVEWSTRSEGAEVGDGTRLSRGGVRAVIRSGQRLWPGGRRCPLCAEARLCDYFHACFECSGHVEEEAEANDELRVRLLEEVCDIYRLMAAVQVRAEGEGVPHKSDKKEEAWSDLQEDLLGAVCALGTAPRPRGEVPVGWREDAEGESDVGGGRSQRRRRWKA